MKALRFKELTRTSHHGTSVEQKVPGENQTIFEANRRGRPPVWDYAVTSDPFHAYQRSYREAWQRTEERALLR